MEFVLVFAVVFIVGFVIRETYRLMATTKCHHCHAQVDKAATACRFCGRDLYKVG